MYSYLSSLFYYLLITGTTIKSSELGIETTEKKIEIYGYYNLSNLSRLLNLLREMDTEHYYFEKEVKELQPKNKKVEISLDKKIKFFSKLKNIYTQSYNILKDTNFHSETFINLPFYQKNLETISYILGCFIFEVMTSQIIFCLDDSSFLVNFMKNIDNDQLILKSIIENELANLKLNSKIKIRPKKLREKKYNWLYINIYSFKDIFELLIDVYKKNVEKIKDEKIEFKCNELQNEITSEYIKRGGFERLNSEEQELFSDARAIIKGIEKITTETTPLKFEMLKILAYNFLERFYIQKLIKRIETADDRKTFITKVLFEKIAESSKCMMHNSFICMLALTDKLKLEKDLDLLSQIKLLQNKNTELWECFLKLLPKIDLSKLAKNKYLSKIAKDEFITKFRAGYIYFDKIRRIYIYLITGTYEPYEEYMYLITGTYKL